MSKERLEEIKKNLDPLGYGMGGHLISVNDIYWLIAQAERVQELEKENKRIRQMKYHEAYEQGKFDTNIKVWYEIPKLEQQNNRYREVIEEAREYANNPKILTNPAGIEKILTKALEESK